MGDVVGLAEQRERRDERRAVLMAEHPSLRWVAGRAFYVAHRKDGGAAECGASGPLTLAPPGVPLCVKCYPPPEREALPS
jgi:hypothetical protein